MTTLYPNLFYNQGCYKGTALYILQDMCYYAYKAPNDYMNPHMGVIKQWIPSAAQAISTWQSRLLHRSVHSAKIFYCFHSIVWTIIQWLNLIWHQFIYKVTNKVYCFIWISYRLFIWNSKPYLTLCLLVAISVFCWYFCKQFGSRSGLTKCQTWSGYKLYVTLMVYQKKKLKKKRKDFWKYQQSTKSMKKFPACKELTPGNENKMRNFVDLGWWKNQSHKAWNNGKVLL